jgi:hypothetical protein
MFTSDVSDFRRQNIMAASSKYEWLHTKFAAGITPTGRYKTSKTTVAAANDFLD